MKRSFRLPKSFFNRSFIQVVLTGFFLLFLIYFIRNEHLNGHFIRKTLSHANPFWMLIGIMVTGIYLFMQAILYVFAFKSIGISIGLKSALRLFLKRNFVSTFLPAGTFTSLAFFSDELDRYKLGKGQIHYGSFLFVLASLISIILIALPAIGLLLLNHQARSEELAGVSFLTILIILTALIGYSLIMQSGIPFRMLNRLSPRFVTQIRELQTQHFSFRTFVYTCLISLCIELAGVAHLYIALAALGLEPSGAAALTGYVIMIIILSISPFLRGLGAIEVSVTYVLTLYGYPTIAAAAVTLLFRVFEFWIPFFASMAVFVLRKGNLILRIFPAIFIFLLGVVNVISALTPAIPERLQLLGNFIPFAITEISNLAVLLLGLMLMIASAFLLSGARNAWQLAILISMLSLIGHLVKAIDYEEAFAALVTIGVLWYTRGAYFVRYNIAFQLRSVYKIIILMGALFLYSVSGFYLLHARHLDFDFSWGQSLTAAMKTMIFTTDSLVPQTRTGRYFLYSIQVGTLMVSVYAFFLRYRASRRWASPVDPGDARTLAATILDTHGDSSLDSFKIGTDKQFFFSEDQKAFLSYAESRHYALVLENPVAGSDQAKADLLNSFEHYCSAHGLRNFYYRVTEADLPLYAGLHKKWILLGQEAIVDLSVFSLEGSSKKSMRNALRKIENGGFHFKIYTAPLRDGFIQQLKAVSDKWLHQDGHAESGFSQGVFDEHEIKNCTVLTVENGESKVLAFTNLIRSYKAGEATYDLIRKSDDAPNGVLDFLTVQMIQYFKNNDFKTLNMGLAPLAGMQGNTMNELIMQFYKDHFQQASGFKGLFEYKDKFEPRWENRYLIYDQAFDLVRFPRVLQSVSRRQE